MRHNGIIPNSSFIRRISLQRQYSFDYLSFKIIQISHRLFSIQDQLYIKSLDLSIQYFLNIVKKNMKQKLIDILQLLLGNYLCTILLVILIQNRLQMFSFQSRLISESFQVFTIGKIQNSTHIIYILYSLLHLTHLTFTYSESRRLNFFEPQFVQIGHTRVDFTNYISLDQI